MSGKLILLSNSNLLPVGGKGERKLREDVLDQYTATKKDKHCFTWKFIGCAGDSSEQIHPYLNFTDIIHLLRRII